MHSYTTNFNASSHKICKIFDMWQFCVVLLCLLSTDVSATRAFRSAGASLTPTYSPVVTSSNKVIDNNTPPTSKIIKQDNNAVNTTVVVNASNESTEVKTEEKTKLVPEDDDKKPSLNGIFSKTPTGAALRGLYVFVGLSAIVMLYIAVKLIRLRRKKMKIRKYGLIANADDVEMTPLGAEDDDEDTTLFDAHNHIGR